jgi:hypothetical protein
MLVHPDIHFEIARERLRDQFEDAWRGRLAIRARQRRRRSAGEAPQIEHAARQDEPDLAARVFYRSLAAREPLGGNAPEPARRSRLTRSVQTGAG